MSGMAVQQKDWQMAPITFWDAVPWSRDITAGQSVKQSTITKYVHPAWEQRSAPISWNGSCWFWLLDNGLFRVAWKMILTLHADRKG